MMSGSNSGATKPDGEEAPPPGPDAMPGPMRRVRVSDLMPGERQVILEHAGEHYILRITARGKLILTK
jgi:hemin uptake protein HemP